MSAPSSQTKKRAYRMSARADAAAASEQRLLATAWRHFATLPYEDVLLREIASEAQLSAQTLHNRFHSKEQLFTAAFLAWGATEIGERDTAPVGDVPAAISVLFDRYEPHGHAILRMLSQEERIPAVKQMTDAGRAYHAHWAKRTFAPLLRGTRGAARRRRQAAITAATDLTVWKLLRHDMELSRTDAEAAMIDMLQPRASGE
ncbi:MAG: TetR/AcrR family transcriptional regulator [Solirubrobacteraceae bacterium]